MDGFIIIFIFNLMLRDKLSSDTKYDCKVNMSKILRTFNYHVLINELYPSFVISVFFSKCPHSAEMPVRQLTLK